MNTDMIMMAAILALSVGLVPQVVKNSRSKTCGVVLITTMVNAVSLWVLTWCFFDMGKWFSFGGCVVQGALWTTILGQWFVYRTMTGCSGCRHKMNLWWRKASVCSITGKEHSRTFTCGRFVEERR